MNSLTPVSTKINIILPILSFSLEELTTKELKNLIRELFSIDGIDGHPNGRSVNVYRTPVWWPDLLPWNGVRAIAKRKRQIRSRFVRENKDKENQLSSDNLRVVVRECYRFYNQLGNVKPCPESIINLIDSSASEDEARKSEKSTNEASNRLGWDSNHHHNTAQCKSSISNANNNVSTNPVFSNSLILIQRLPRPKFKKDHKMSFKSVLAALDLLTTKSYLSDGSPQEISQGSVTISPLLSSSDCENEGQGEPNNHRGDGECILQIPIDVNKSTRKDSVTSPLARQVSILSPPKSVSQPSDAPQTCYSSVEGDSSSSVGDSVGDGESCLTAIVGKNYEDEYGRFDDGRPRVKTDNQTLLSVDLSSPLGQLCQSAVQLMKLTSIVGFAPPPPPLPPPPPPPLPQISNSADVNSIRGTATPSQDSSPSSSSRVTAPSIYAYPVYEQQCVKPMSAYQAKIISNLDILITFKPGVKGHVDTKDMSVVSFTRKQRRSRIKDLVAGKNTRRYKRAVAACSVLVDRFDLSRLGERGTLLCPAIHAPQYGHRFLLVQVISSPRNPQLASQLQRTMNPRIIKGMPQTAIRQLKPKYRNTASSTYKTSIPASTGTHHQPNNHLKRKSTDTSVIVLSSDDEASGPRTVAPPVGGRGSINAQASARPPPGGGENDDLVTDRNRPLQFRCRICGVRISFTLNRRSPVTEHFLREHRIDNIRLTEAVNDDGSIAMNIVKNNPTKEEEDLKRQLASGSVVPLLSIGGLPPVRSKVPTRPLPIPPVHIGGGVGPYPSSHGHHQHRRGQPYAHQRPDSQSLSFSVSQANQSNRSAQLGDSVAVQHISQLVARNPAPNQHGNGNYALPPTHGPYSLQTPPFGLRQTSPPQQRNHQYQPPRHHPSLSAHAKHHQQYHQPRAPQHQPPAKHHLDAHQHQHQHQQMKLHHNHHAQLHSTPRPSGNPSLDNLDMNSISPIVRRASSSASTASRYRQPIQQLFDINATGSSSRSPKIDVICIE